MDKAQLPESDEVLRERLTRHVGDIRMKLEMLTGPDTPFQKNPTPENLLSVLAGLVEASGEFRDIAKEISDRGE
ncbi:hypothetical protein AB0N17_41930 [Streptomyces sp. NPDC051133]|uniref:hypothetical protein n=1 Tax=Streptomyces sp. NPDC051133 TaxID=3155521 RepID=UPI003443F198